jgi:hypothetical protein
MLHGCRPYVKMPEGPQCSVDIRPVGQYMGRDRRSRMGTLRFTVSGPSTWSVVLNVLIVHFDNATRLFVKPAVQLKSTSDPVCLTIDPPDA